MLRHDHWHAPNPSCGCIRVQLRGMWKRPSSNHPLFLLSFIHSLFSAAAFLGCLTLGRVAHTSPWARAQMFNLAGGRGGGILKASFLYTSLLSPPPLSPSLCIGLTLSHTLHPSLLPSLSGLATWPAVRELGSFECCRVFWVSKFLFVFYFWGSECVGQGPSPFSSSSSDWVGGWASRERNTLVGSSVPEPGGVVRVRFQRVCVASMSHSCVIFGMLALGFVCACSLDMTICIKTYRCYCEKRTCLLHMFMVPCVGLHALACSLLGVHRWVFKKC
jgi:hypothetical protein